jgi:predicted PurR-regulated permease PerM
MAEETTPKELSTKDALPEGPAIGPNTPGPATAEAIKKAPEAVRRSMPMAISIMLGILLAGLAGWFFQNLTWFILLLYLSLIAATILEAPVQWLKRAGMRRGMAAVVVMVSLLAVTGGIGYFVTLGIYSQVAAVKENLTGAPERINRWVNGFMHQIAVRQHHAPAAAAQPAPPVEADPAMPAAEGTVPASAPAATGPTTAPQTQPEFDVIRSLQENMPSFSSVWTNAMSGVEAVSWLVIMFFIVLYMLIDGADHLKAIRCLIPKRSRLETTRLFNEISKAHRGWALASLSNVASSTILTSLGLWIVGVPGAILLGFFAGLGELIPNIGPVLGAMPAILLTLVAQPDKFFSVCIMFVIVQTVQSYTISPMMLKISVELPVLVTIVSVLVFGTLFGFLGILVAIPLVADMVVVWQYANRYIEKDTEDYDQVNSPAYGARTPMSPDNTRPGRLRKLFRRDRRATAPDPAAASQPQETGLDRLEKVERNAGGRQGNGSGRPVSNGDPARP